MVGAGMRDGDGGRPNGPGLPDPSDIEAALLRIQGIQAARVVTGPGGRVTEVHVLAGRERGAKQLVRDVQSVILTNFGLDIDYRTVSVVQLDEPTPAAETADRPAGAPARPAGSLPASRPALVRLQTETASFATEVRVGVQLGAGERAGQARGPSTAGLRLVAEATADAVSALLEGAAVEVQQAEVLAVGPTQVAVVLLRLATSRGEQTLSGSAPVRKDANDAVARATLDALNRVLGAP
jgi:hypothetical protein